MGITLDLKELCESIDIVEYISQYVDLEERGQEFWGLSPFKDENTPSFSVRKETASWYDFSSGLGGNLYTFVKAYHKCSSAEAVNLIKKYAGIDGDIEISPSKKKMAATLIAKKFAPVKARQKESKSTILPDDYMDRYECRPDKLLIWEDEGISQESMKKFGIMYDGFQNRIVYPVRDECGHIINVCGRTLDFNWKEKRQPKYIYRFPLGRLDTLGGLFENKDAILQSGKVIIFEGIKSVMKADTWGIYNSCALFTSHLNSYQLKILARLGVCVVFALDKGVDITQDINIKRLKRYARVEYLLDTEGLLQDKDSPVDHGMEIFKMLYERRRSLR